MQDVEDCAGALAIWARTGWSHRWLDMSVGGKVFCPFPICKKLVFFCRLSAIYCYETKLREKKVYGEYSMKVYTMLIVV